MFIDDSLVLERSGSFALLRSGFTWFGIAEFFLHSKGGCFFGGRILFPALGFFGDNHDFPQGFYVILNS